MAVVGNLPTCGGASGSHHLKGGVGNRRKIAPCAIWPLPDPPPATRTTIPIPCRAARRIFARDRRSLVPGTYVTEAATTKRDYELISHLARLRPPATRSMGPGVARGTAFYPRLSFAYREGGLEKFSSLFASATLLGSVRRRCAGMLSIASSLFWLGQPINQSALIKDQQNRFWVRREGMSRSSGTFLEGLSLSPCYPTRSDSFLRGWLGGCSCVFDVKCRKKIQ